MNQGGGGDLRGVPRKRAKAVFLWGRGTVFPVFAAICLAILPPGCGDLPSHGRWFTAWETAEAPLITGQFPELDRKTIREFAHISVSGERFRVTLSNKYGQQPLRIEAAHLARRSQGGAIDPASDVELNFRGKTQVEIPSGGTAVSDSAAITAESGSELAVSLEIIDAGEAITGHYFALERTYVSAGGAVATPDMTASATTTNTYFLERIEASGRAGNILSNGIVAFGDSITDGYGSTVDANLRWPDVLGERMAALSRRGPEGVANAGLGGNRLLHGGAAGYGFYGVSGLDRFDHDALELSNVRTVIVFEGINDLCAPGNQAPLKEAVTVAEMIAGYEKLIERAHARHIRIAAGTLTPFLGSSPYSAEAEQKRGAINEWFRAAGEFDAVFDFDAAIRDPSNPQRLLPAYDCGDHLHPNDAGYRRIAETVDLSRL